MISPGIDRELRERGWDVDATMPRNRAAIPLWVDTLEDCLRRNRDEDALRNRVHHLP